MSSFHSLLMTCSSRTFPVDGLCSIQFPSLAAVCLFLLRTITRSAFYFRTSILRILWILVAVQSFPASVDTAIQCFCLTNLMIYFNLSSIRLGSKTVSWTCLAPDPIIGRSSRRASITSSGNRPPSTFVPASQLHSRSVHPRDGHDRLLDSPHTQPCFIPTQTKKTVDYRTFRNEKI